MEEIKKEEQQEVVQEKEYYTKQEVEQLINKKTADIFGDLIKELNKTTKKEPEVVKEKTIDDFRF